MKDPLFIEKKTLTAMIKIYCESVHGRKALCDDCRNLQDYALQRIERCVYGNDKPACKNCPVHCYKPKRKEEIRNVMRFSGPKMVYRHPVLAVTHLIKDGRTIQKPKIITS
ncbi:MAG: nitrous oxide-stimulated promoter family protein [Bacteroidetes bacterium]|nr:nitrous oxide-stimulated promoter family protein [Bacteroidota bacterium]